MNDSGAYSLYRNPTNNILILVCSFLLILTSCSPTYYSPSAQSIPELSQKNDLYVGGSYLFMNSSIGYLHLSNTHASQVYVSYSPIHNLGLGLEYNNATDLSGSKWNKFDFNLGYYDTIDSSFSYNVYLVSSLGELKLFESLEQLEANFLSKQWSLSLRPSISYQQDRLRLRLSANIMRMGYYNILDGSNNLENSIYLNDNLTHTLIEPSITLTFDRHHVDFELQYGRSFNLTNPDFRQYNSYLSIGANLSLDAFKPN